MPIQDDLKNLTRCSQCVMPETVAGITFDKNGVCNICLNVMKKKKKNFVKKEEDLKHIFKQFKGKGKYDCLVPFSGGKDSSYVLYKCIEYGVNPLAYNFNNHFQTNIGRQNMNKVVETLGVDMINYSYNWEVCKDLCVKGLNKIGDFCWFCNSGIIATSIQRAITEDIPLIVFGESAAEYQGKFDFDDTYEKIFIESAQEAIPETEFIDEKISIDKLKPFTLPNLEERKKLKVIYLGNYIKWDKEEIVQTIKNDLGWEEGSVKGASTTFEHIDCKFAGVRHYIKFLKRGYGTYTSLASIKIREGKMTREEALKEIEKDGKEPESLNDFLESIELNRDKFFEIVNRHKKY